MRIVHQMFLATILLLLPAAAHAASVGMLSTDRFGYAGTITRYDSQAAYQSGAAAIDTMQVSDRDASLYVTSGMDGRSDQNIVMGSWWYTTVANEDGSPKDGWGNTTGNTGIGFTQLYDWNSSSDSLLDLYFGNLVGGFYTDFTLHLTGGEAPYYNEQGAPEDYSRLSATSSNTSDWGVWHEYELMLTATGLEGVLGTDGLIEATDHPDGVTGSFSGLFENLTETANAGFYVVDFSLNMDNWAYAMMEEGLLVNDFEDSLFAAEASHPVPEPATLLFFGAGSLGVWAARRRRTR